MSLTETTYLVVGASFALYIFIAIRSRAGSTQEFYVAGKGIHPVANGMATAADWMSAASFISMAGLIGLSTTAMAARYFDGLDRRLCDSGHADRAVPEEIWEVHRPRVHWRSVLL